MSRFEVELVGSSHDLNQEDLIDNFLSVIFSFCYSFNQYILGNSYMHNNVLGTMEDQEI